jgi:hypothetical protein
MHTGETPCKCTVSGNTFGWKSQLIPRDKYIPVRNFQAIGDTNKIIQKN